MAQIDPPKPNALIEWMAKLLREKAPAVGDTMEKLTGPENPPVNYAAKLLNAGDPMGMMGLGNITSLAGPQIAKYAKLIKEDIRGTGRGFATEKYPASAKVKVTFRDGVEHIDEVKGLNEGHAMARAASNWPDAVKIDLLPSHTVIPE